MTRPISRLRVFRGGALALFVAVTSFAGPAAADKVRTRAWAHDGYGRIVFDWPAPVTFTAKMSDGRLTVNFDRAVATSFALVKRNLGDYVADVALGAGGKSVVAKLRNSYRLRSFAENNSVVVDLVQPPAAVRARRSESRKRPEAARPPPALGVRTGEHLGFGRIVFDWTRWVRYSVVKSGGEVTIKFDRSARIDLANLKSHLPEPLSGDVTITFEGRGLAVTFIAPDDVRLRHFRDGPKVVLDILSGARNELAAKDKGPPRLVEEALGVLDETVPVKRGLAPVALLPGADRDPRPGKRSTDKRSTGKRRLMRHVRTFGPQAAIVTVDVDRNGNDLVITFNWRSPVAAVAYLRDDRLWLVFDAASRVALGPIRVTGSGIIKRVQQYPQPGATLIGLSLPARYEAEMTRDDMLWRLELRNRDPSAHEDHGLPVRTESGPGGRQRVVVPVQSASKPIQFRDPDIGDMVVAVAVAESGQRLADKRSFVEFAMFPTVQGIAIRRKSDEIHVAVDKSAVVISTPDGLALSPAEDLSRHGALLESDRPLWNMIDWQRGTREEYERIEHDLISRVIDAPPARRNAERIALARFYLSHGMAADAVGVARTVMRQQPTEAQLNELRALRGAASFLLRHYGDAMADLSHRHLRDEPGVAPWLAAIAAERGDWRAANDGFTGTEEAIARLPRWLAQRFTMTALEAALAVDDLERGRQLLERLQLEALPQDKIEYLDYLRAHLLKKDGKPKEALQIWTALSNSGDRLVRAKSAFASIETRRELGELNPAEAVKQLDKLSFAWRGDAFEFDLLKRLGELFIAAKDYRNGLIRLRQAASYFENVDGADAVAKVMEDFFKKLYLDGLADELPPVRALALYEEFRELTPPGVDGEKMVRRLADRLAKVDLLDEAAALLSHQIQFRLDGEQKARVATRLAEIRLLDREPMLALEALKESEAPDLPEELVRARGRIEARALGELKRPEEAMSVLRGDYGREADEVRLGILWRARSWRAAADVIQRSMGFRGVELGNVEEARRVMQWAVALAMIDDGAGLSVLRDRFLADMSSTPFAKPFRAIVGTGTATVPDFETLTDQISNLDNLKSFLASFRDEIQTGKGDTVN